MTNAEMFLKVFGIPPEKAKEIYWSNKYRKLKRYIATLRFPRTPHVYDRVIVYAPNKEDAHSNAILKFTERGTMRGHVVIDIQEARNDIYNSGRSKR